MSTEYKSDSETEKDNFLQLSELDQLLEQVEREVIPMIEESSIKIEIDLPIYLIDTILKGAVNTLILSIERGYHYANVISEEGYELVRPLLTPWKKACKEKKFDEELFNDFKSSLIEFTEMHPDYSGDGWTFDSFFNEKIWPFFDDRYKKAKKQSQKIQSILERKLNRSDVLIESEYALIDPYQFEHLIAELFQKMGYETEVTSGSCDYGIDIIAKSNHDVIAIQAKKYSKGNNVGNRAVQRLLGAMQYRSVRANKAILITSSDFTVQANEQAKETPIELWNGYYLNKMIKKYL